MPRCLNPRTGSATLLLILTLLSAWGCGGTRPRSGSDPIPDVIVVGAGLGGLVSALRLSQAGLRVLVLEQQHQVGGCNTSFSRGEFNFDATLHGMSLGTDQGNVRSILEEIGLLDQVELIRTPELARSIYPGLDYVSPATLEETIAGLKERWPAEAEDIDAFYQLAADISSEMMELKELYRKSGFVAGLYKLLIPLRQRQLFKWRNATLADVFAEYFNSEELELVISQYWMYLGPPPSRIWAPMFLLSYYSYVKNGAWQVRGSSQALSNALAELIKTSGGEIRTDTLVSEIVVRDGRARGVKTADGEHLEARYLVSNADPFQTFRQLVGKDNTPEEAWDKLERLEPSNSLVSVYLGLDVPSSFWGIPEYEIFYHTSRDQDAMYEAMLQGRFADGAVTLVFYSNLGDDYYAPPGKSVLVLNAYSERQAWPEKRGPAYRAQKQAMKETLIGLAENVLPGLRDHILVSDAATPLTIERFTHNHDGVPYGMDLVPGNRENIMKNETPIENLYLTGAWIGLVHGNGGAIISGDKAARLILDKENLDPD